MSISNNFRDRDKQSWSENAIDGGVDRRVNDLTNGTKLDQIAQNILYTLLANARWMINSDIDKIIPSVIGDTITLQYQEELEVLGEASFRYVDPTDWDLTLTTYLNDDDGEHLLDDDDEFLDLG